MTKYQEPEEAGDDHRDSAPGIFVFLLGVALGNLNMAVLVFAWRSVTRWFGW